jgi:hypothetical protein
MADWELSQLASLAAPAQNVKVPVLNVNDASTPPADVNGSDQVVTWGQVGSAASADVSRVMLWGHSYPAGFGNTEGGERYADRMCAALGAEQVNYAVSGSILALDQSAGNPGGYPTVINWITPRTQAAGVYSPRNSAPFLPLSPVHVFDHGFNDLGNLTSNATTNIAWFKMAERAVLCLARSGGWFPDTDGSVAYSAGWTANTSVQDFGWPTNHSTTTITTTTVTITVPAAFPGGEVDLYSYAFAGASGGGTKWSTKVDGGAAQVLDGTGSAFGSNNGHANLVVQRLTGLAAGSHTIVATVAALDATATAFFAGWSTASPWLPVCVLVNTPLVPSLPITGGTHSPLTATDTTNLNAAKVALAAEFTDGNVVIADIATAFAAAGGNVTHTAAGSLYASDDLHPNVPGHALIAQVVRDAIRSAPLPSAMRLGAMGQILRTINGPLEIQLAANWSVLGGTTSYYSRSASGSVELYLTFVKSTAGVLNEVICTLPPGYWPPEQTYAFGVSWDNTFTTPSLAILTVTTNGQVQWTFGDPTNLLAVKYSYQAYGPGA